MQVRRIGAAAILWLFAAACGQDTTPQPDLGDIRGVEEIGSSGALTALVGKATFNATTGIMLVPLNVSDKLLIVSKQNMSNAILLNGHPVLDTTGLVTALAVGTTGVVKSIGVTVADIDTTVILDYINGTFAPGITGTGTVASPIFAGTTVDFAAYTGCAFKIRATSNNDTIYFGKDKTASTNKLISLNTGNFGDIWIKGSATVLYGVGLGSGDDVFNASPGATVLTGILTPFTDPIVVHGGVGNDTITGGLGADTIYGDEGNNLVDESAYQTSPTPTVTASATRTLKFDAAGTITAAGTAAGSFIVDGFVAGSSIIVTGTTLNGTVAIPRTFTIAALGVAATVLTVTPGTMFTEAAYVLTATVVQPNTVHASDSVYGLAASGVTTVTYASRTYGRAGAGVVVKLGHDIAVPPAFLAGTEDNLDESVAVVIGTDFPDVMSCSDTTDAPCTLVGGKGDDTLTAGLSATSTHLLYGGDGNDKLIVTKNTDKALLMGGNWADATARSLYTLVANSTRTLKFDVAKTITASTGDFVADAKFVVGQSIVVTGTVANGTTAAPKTFTIATVTTTAITVAEAVTTETAYPTLATITLPAIVAPPKNAWIDTADFSAVTAPAVTIDLNFAYPLQPKAYALGTLNLSGSSAHTSVTKDITYAICPQVSAEQVCTFKGNSLVNSTSNYVKAGMGADVLTGGTGDDTFDLGTFDPTVLGQNLKVVTGNGGVDSVDFSRRALVDTTVDITCTTATCKTSGSTQMDPGKTVTASSTRKLSFTKTASVPSNGITASSGSFLLDGFAIGQKIVVANTASDNATYSILTVDATVITVNEAVSADEVLAASATVTRAAADPGIVITAGGTHGALTFANTGSTLTAVSGDFATDGFIAGQTFVVAGTASNNGTFTIKAGGVAAKVLTLTGAPALVDETIATVATITRAPAAKLVEGISLVGITNLTCPASADGSLSCFIVGNNLDNTLDFNGCKGSVSCGGGSDLVLNASRTAIPAVNVSCGF